METVNNLASAASRAIWGDQSTAEQDTTKNETAGQEPLSGQTGDVKSGEPYDKGNIGGKLFVFIITKTDPANSYFAE